jgi:predicted nuclease with TOPRIM domain
MNKEQLNEAAEMESDLAGMEKKYGTIVQKNMKLNVELHLKDDEIIDLRKKLEALEEKLASSAQKPESLTQEAEPKPDLSSNTKSPLNRNLLETQKQE